jgi:hypothetical protein
MTLFSTGVFGYCLNSIGNIVKELSIQEEEFKKKMDILTKYLRQRGLSYNS